VCDIENGGKFMAKCPFEHNCKNCLYCKVEETIITYYILGVEEEFTVPGIPTMICTYEETLNKGDE
jgi:hypothetical protein